jgi:methylated-DNA-[protein]-cysteine S-methyltransferase
VKRVPMPFKLSIQTVYCRFSVGVLKITADESAILSCDVVQESSVFNGLETSNRHPILDDACGQLNDYFAGTRQQFDLPLRWQGSAFRQRVWQSLCRIPYGETRSYSDIAAALGQPKAARAIGQANHHNPLIIIVPCHRVIGKSGALVGYGAGLTLKAWLLQHERLHLR